jgi:pectate lyase
MFPSGSQFDFSSENATDPSAWPNPSDVEFVYTGCDAINCWIQPRCTVDSVEGSLVSLKGADGSDNSSCFHRLYYYPKCFSNGKGADKKTRGINPTHLENVGTNFTQPGQFYYDRAGASIGYIPRQGETAADLEATATTATQQEILVVKNTQNLKWEGVHFEYATWLGASGPKGYIDTQSAYLCMDGEPPTNILVQRSRNITFSGCSFQHLGAVYALGANGGSQDVIVSNNTFADISGGGVKLGSSGERGAKAPNVTLDPSLQDRGFLVSDNTMSGFPTEYSGANQIFAGYVADTDLVHNSLSKSSYSAICAGWGWGEASYMRNVRIDNNTIDRPMLLLADGGGVYTNTPCPDCHVSGNYFSNDAIKYGCLYHDGGSSLWHDYNNVFDNVQTAIIFTHGSSQNTTVDYVWYNGSGHPNLQGDTNHHIRDKNGKCRNATLTKLDLKTGDPWPAAAQAIISNAGRRQSFPLPVAPVLSPPAPKGIPTPSCFHPKPPGMRLMSTLSQLRCITYHWMLSSHPPPRCLRCKEM